MPEWQVGFIFPEQNLLPNPNPNKSLILTASSSTWKALEAQLQNLQQSANDAATAVNARGTLLVHRLHDILNRAREIATRGVRQGAAAALAMVQARSEHELHFLQPGFPKDEGPIDFDDLIDEFERGCGGLLLM